MAGQESSGGKRTRDGVKVEPEVHEVHGVEDGSKGRKRRKEDDGLRMNRRSKNLY